MKPLLIALSFAIALLALGLFVGDYMNLREQVRFLKPQTEQQPAQDEQEPSETYVLFGKSLKLTDSALVLLTGFLAWFTLMLFLDAREKGRLELRAYLGIKEQGIRELGGGRFQAFIVIENSGKTPAHGVRVAFEVGVGDADTPQNGFVVGNLSGSMPLGPSGQRDMRRVIREIRPEDVDRIGVRGMNRSAFAWGRIEYRDIYGEQRHVNFRFVTREVSTEMHHDAATGRVVHARVTGWPLQPTEYGNDAS